MMIGVLKFLIYLRVSVKVFLKKYHPRKCADKVSLWKLLKSCLAMATGFRSLVVLPLTFLGKTLNI